MEQYINKSAVVAEIERIMAEEMSFFKDCCKDGLENTSSPVVYTRMEMLLSFLDTLEVKEVDLEKESELIANEIMIEVQANKYHTNIYNTERNDFNHSHLWLAARKGIELGLKSQKGE